MEEAQRTPFRPVEDEGLLFGCILDGEGGATMVGWPEVEAWKEGDAPLWVHLNQAAPRVQSWLAERSGLTEITAQALLATESRPRVFRGKRGYVTILRGANTNPDAEPEDMVAMRMWSDGKRVITVRDEKLMTPLDILSRLMDSENGPHTAAELYERLIARLTERVGITIENIAEEVDRIEDKVETASGPDLRRQVSAQRRKLANLRRYIAPQREALGSLLANPPEWLDDASRLRLRETADRTMLCVEEIDAAREQALVLKDEISSQLSETTNRTLYVLAIISGIFLPFGFLTGLFGINVGGMPGIDSGNAFYVFCGVLVGLLIAELLVFKRLKWF